MRISLASHDEELLYDPQTSGGLLLAVPDAQAKDLITDLQAAGVKTAVRIGHIEDGEVGITVT
jgi:selenide,water dikinase